MATEASDSPSVTASVANGFRHAEALQVLETRRGLEREAARLAAERRTDADLEVLDDLLAGQLLAAETGDREGFVRADAAFHRALAAAAHNPVLADLIDHLGPHLDATIAVVVEEHQGTAEKFRTHTDLALAIREGRAEDAATLADALMAAAIALVRASRAR